MCFDFKPLKKVITNFHLISDILLISKDWLELGDGDSTMTVKVVRFILGCME